MAAPKIDDALTVTSWITIEHARDVSETWVGHCLDFDVISQGGSPEDAIRMTAEAVAMTIVDDVQHDLDPRDRRAPPASWDQLARVLARGERVDLAELPEIRRHRDVIAAAELTIVFNEAGRGEPGDLTLSHRPIATVHVG